MGKHHNHHNHSHDHHDHHEHHHHDEELEQVDENIMEAIDIHEDETTSEENTQFLPNYYSFTGAEKSNMVKLIIMISMVVVFFFAELIVGYIGKSLALVSDSFHMLSDGISLVIGLVAIIVSVYTVVQL
jgi:zinc transporter 1